VERGGECERGGKGGKTQKKRAIGRWHFVGGMDLWQAGVFLGWGGGDKGNVRGEEARFG